MRHTYRMLMKTEKSSTKDSTVNIYTESEIDSLLSNIIGGKGSNEEILFFSEWIKDYKNERYFYNFKEMWHVATDIDYRVNYSSLKGDVEFMKDDRLRIYIKNSRRKELYKRIYIYSASVAASLVLIFSVINLIVDKPPFSSLQKSSTSDLTALSYSTDSIRVELNNGKEIKKIKGETKQVAQIVENDIVMSSNGGQVKQISSKKEAIQNVYNSISTPPGERATMVLSDGTKVYLTSNSYLRYPSHFDNNSREVALIGRAYFEVKKSKTPFIVKTSDMKIEVLGTSFDVESKPSVDKASVILVEGSVKVFADGLTKLIKPDEQFSIQRTTKVVSVSNVDAKLMTMWKDGVLVVQGQTIDELIENLSSWYGVRIINKSSVPKFERFNGRFDREDIETAVKTLCINANVRYRVESGNLIIEDL